MKRYLVFYGDVYYPIGGMDDLLCDCATLAMAYSRLNGKAQEEMKECQYDTIEEHWEYRWGYIYDTKTRTKIEN